MKRHGFSWVELVTTLAGLSLLSAVLFPVFTRSRESCPKRPTCQDNIRRVGLSIKQYRSDYGESFPTVDSGGTNVGWAGALWPYLKNTAAFQCPADTSKPPTSPATTVTGADPNYCDYFYNSHLAGENESALRCTAATVMLGDATPGDARQHSTGGASTRRGIANFVNRPGTPVGAATRHLDGANYAFADGHVKWILGRDAHSAFAIHNAASGASSVSGSYSFGID
jgi:prepilin-type processing-associated H-X9-DG protein